MSIQSAVVSGQIAQAFVQLKGQVILAKKTLTEGRPAIIAGPNASPALSPEAIAEIVGDDGPKYLAACEAFLEKLAK